jgi:universal stress protein A
VSDASVFARIVCGVDGSNAGLEAVRQSRRFETDGSRIVIVSVSEAHLAVHAGMIAGQASDEIDADAQAALDAAVAEGGDVDKRLIRGRAHETLLRVAAEEGATLLAVGSHEIPRGPGMVLGSVATRVVHDAPCSVLVARAPAVPGQFPRAIVAGVDGSPASLDAARVAEELGKRLGAHVTVLAAMGASEDEIDVEELNRSGVDVQHADEKAVPALVEASKSADLLVVASRGVRGVRTLGSVSERVAHQAHCSLLVYRPPGVVGSASLPKIPLP